MIAQSELELPSAWRIAKLKDVATIERNALQPEEISKGTSYLGLENIDSGGGALSPKIVEKGDLASSKFQFTNRHVLYGKLRPYLAKIACPEFKGICSTDILPILPGPKLDRQFLCYFLRQPSMVDYANSRAAGANLPRLSPATLEDFKIPVPPLAVQHRIAAVLDEADELRAKRRAALAELDTLTQSLFLEMFGNPVTNPWGWDLARLGEVASTSSGGTPKRDVGAYFGGQIPWVKSGELHQALVTSTEEFLTEAGLAESSAKLIEPGAVLVAMYGATVGAIALLGIKAATNQAICCITVSRQLDTSFLVSLLKRLTPSLLAKRVGGAQPNLSQDLLRNLVIPVPPLHLQQEFARHVTAVETLKAKHRAALTELDALFASLQHRAFRGEL